MVNCFSCFLDTVGSVVWQVELDNGDRVQPDLSPDAEAVGNFLVLAMPENYVEPGTAGRKYIVCTSQLNNSNVEVRLASPSKRLRVHI